MWTSTSRRLQNTSGTKRSAIRKDRSMQSNKSHIPITRAQLADQFVRANARLKKVTFKPTKRCSTISDAGLPVWTNVLLTEQAELSVSIFTELKKVSKDDL